MMILKSHEHEKFTIKKQIEHLEIHHVDVSPRVPRRRAREGNEGAQGRGQKKPRAGLQQSHKIEHTRLHTELYDKDELLETRKTRTNQMEMTERS